MPSDLPFHHSLSRKTMGRLRFISHTSSNGELTVPCRLPGCDEVVTRRSGAGRSRWFHDRKCVDDFRTRQRALDAAIDELAELATAHSSERELAAIRSDLDWLLDVRSTYVTPGHWRRTALPEDTSSMPDLEYIRFVQDQRVPVDRCPTCDGTGDLKDRRSPTPSTGAAKRREEVDLLAGIAPKLSRLLALRPTLLLAEAWDEVLLRATEAEETLRQSLSQRDAVL